MESSAGFCKVLAGTSIFLAIQYILALAKLAGSSGEMENKFSVLARDKYVGFLVLQNLQMLIAYLVLAVVGTILIQPIVSLWTKRAKSKKWQIVILRSFVIAVVIHAYFTLRLVETRPYFLDEAEFGNWYYRVLEVIPTSIKPVVQSGLFSAFPIVGVILALGWQIRHRGRFIKAAAVIVSAALGVWLGVNHLTKKPVKIATVTTERPMNVIIIGSDSLRGDRLGCANYKPSRTDGLAAAGVSPNIDALATRSTRFENCYTSIASTMESGVQLMASQYPQNHGLRHMYPNRETVEATKMRIETLPAMLRKKNYDTAAIGDWCAGYYEVIPLGFEHLSVSTFDNFKIYMSQAVVMAHFVVPLYFDNPLGYQIFPQIGAFAQFVTPEVVTDRVEKRLNKVADEQKPFFWHVFYSCNHLPFGSAEPYCSMFSDPSYRGPNRNKVDFDIDSFIGGTDLESKWQALPQIEVNQIRALYDGSTRQFDDCVGKILAALKRHGLDDNTIVIVTSDHGDDLYEPGVTLGHGLTLNGGLHSYHIPLIVHVPKTSPQVIPETVRLIDVIPTLADLLGVEKSDRWQGKSFANWLHQTEKPEFRPFYAETGFPFVQFKVKGIERPQLPPMDESTRIDETFNYQFVLKDEYVKPLIAAKQRCLKTRNWKLVCTPTAQGTRHFGLFQMAKDPHGEVDLASVRPEVLAPMVTALERWIDQQVESSILEIFPAGEPE